VGVRPRSRYFAAPKEQNDIYADVDATRAFDLTFGSNVSAAAC
jgi:hypothetical protein